MASKLSGMLMIAAAGLSNECWDLRKRSFETPISAAIESRVSVVASGKFAGSKTPPCPPFCRSFAMPATISHLRSSSGTFATVS